MQETFEIFETQRQFNNKFPSKLYTCSKCGTLTDNPYLCITCKNQSNNFFLTEHTYKYKILETGITEEIFKPIELQKESEETNDRKRNKSTTS